jgi:hypothetical protein
VRREATVVSRRASVPHWLEVTAMLTVAHFEVDDIEAEVRDLTSHGVTFEEVRRSFSRCD